MMEIGLETFSYHLAFGRGFVNVFDFISRTAELGLDGVQIKTLTCTVDINQASTP